jgi:hypothetical protein
MSKLVEAIQTIKVGTFRDLPDEIPIEIKVAATREPFPGHGYTEYRVRVMMDVRGYLSEQAARDGSIDVAAQLIDMLKRHMIEEVFGEFRPNIRRLRELACNIRGRAFSDFDTMKKLLAEIDQLEWDMFRVDK